MATDHAFRFYSWGERWQWEMWMGYFVKLYQSSLVIDSNQLPQQTNLNNSTIFLNSELWRLEGDSLSAAYPQLKIHNLTADQRLLAIEIP
jgi:hypothetical protein